MFEKIKELFKPKGESNISKEIQNAPKVDAPQSNTPVYDRRNDFLSVHEMENCLLQQTTRYKRGMPIVAATNKENELFLVYFVSNFFDIVKVKYDANGKLNVIYDYRKNNFLSKELKYEMSNQCITAELRMARDVVSFIIYAKLDCSPWGYSAYLDQTLLFNQISSNFKRYQDGIASYAAEHDKKNDYGDLLQYTKKISEEDKKKIFDLIDADNRTEAAKMIRELTGLGLPDAIKIGNNPHMYL